MIWVRAFEEKCIAYIIKHCAPQLCMDIDDKTKL